MRNFFFGNIVRTVVTIALLLFLFGMIFPEACSRVSDEVEYRATNAVGQVANTAYNVVNNENVITVAGLAIVVFILWLLFGRRRGSNDHH